jgi:hypothetical protein
MMRSRLPVRVVGVCAWGALSLAGALLAGCGPGGPRLAPVRGTVTYRGRPVTTGTVTFVPDQPGPAASGEIRPDGTYVLSTDGRAGAVPGRHTVMIVSLEDNAGRLPEERQPLPALLVPEKYGNNRRSGLTAEVREGENGIDFHLSALHFLPISFSNSSSVSTGTPSARALSSLLPALSPATT